jgi:hypothetical protein
LPPRPKARENRAGADLGGPLVYLKENEVGFDQNDIGFPSISGCHAIVYVTANGLFGIHNFGGADQASWADRSAVFANFVTNHPPGPGTGRHLYGVCYATGANSRGYGLQAPKAVWTRELAAFAMALGYGGPISGYDLVNRGIPPSVYVLFHNVGSTCVIQVKAWTDNDATRGPNATPLDHQMFRRHPNGVGYFLQQTSQNVVTAVTTTGLVTVYPEKLRG